MFVPELEVLLQERDLAKTAADKLAVDDRIRERFLARKALLISDMAGFTRITQSEGILAFLCLIQRMRAICQPVVEREGGRVFKMEADNLFCVFDDPLAAARCGAALVEALEADNVGRPELDRVTIAVGIGWGDLLDLDGQDYYGDAMNMASKLGEDIAEDGEILITMPAFHEADRDGKVSELFDTEPRSMRISGVEVRHVSLFRAGKRP
jgi:adenylate cyclase